MTVTVLPVPAFLVSNVAVPPVRVTLSVPNTPVRVRVAMVAAVVPSYGLLLTVTCGVTLSLRTLIVTVVLGTLL